MTDKWRNFDELDDLKTLPGIYMIYCIPSKKYYIGETLNIKKRILEHIRYKRQLIHKVINRRGIENFLYFVEYMKNFSKLDLITLEKCLIRKYDSLVPNGYNICEEGSDQTNRKLSDETKKKMSEARKGKKHSEETKSKIANSNKGSIRSNETKQKMSNTRMGIKLSNETKQRISDGSKGEKCGPLSEDHKQKISNSNKGKKQSEETKNKLSEIRKGKTRSEETKKRMSEARKRYLDTK